MFSFYFLLIYHCSRSSYERYHKSYCDSNLTYYQVILGGFSEATFDVILMTGGNQSFVIKAKIATQTPMHSIHNLKKEKYKNKNSLLVELYN